jgi:hypothetical protein
LVEKSMARVSGLVASLFVGSCFLVNGYVGICSVFFLPSGGVEGLCDVDNVHLFRFFGR